MNQKDQGDTERSKTSQESMGTGSGTSQQEDHEDSITSGSPKNLVLVAVAVSLLLFAGVVFHIAAYFADSHTNRDNWQLADTVIGFVSTAIFYSALLVGLGTLATARSKGDPSRPTAVASLLSKAGAAVVILAVAEAICIIGTNHYGQGWQWEASWVAFRVAARVFEAGVLAGLALLCLRVAKAIGPGNQGT